MRCAILCCSGPVSQTYESKTRSEWIVGNSETEAAGITSESPVIRANVEAGYICLPTRLSKNGIATATSGPVA